ncbi:MAG TPA: DEAD/DEAH box helicase family protein, partial [Planctomycetaceae bacterium]|nr:DEAD/DEAH box helicase family protein [Planctomycetaceae bacterium]
MPKHYSKPDKLICNSAFVEPNRHWKYDAKYALFDLVEQRREAGYMVATPGSQNWDDPGHFVRLELVNRIRPLVTAWRQSNYPGVTGTTRRLLEHWYDVSQRDHRRFFFCQHEAIETLIWLAEVADLKAEGIVIPGDGGPFSRWCTKLATGTGKTVVMAMLIAWQTLNKAADKSDSRFSNNMLVLAPGLTVKSRLSVLVPDSPGNYYDEFCIVPSGMIDPLRQGRVLVHNWHKLDWETDEEIAKRRSVDKRGAQSDEAYAREVLGEMASARDLIAINDEAHHAWRLTGDVKSLDVNREEIDEATKWIGGLDRIHRARGIKQCFDFSATPYVPSGKKASEEALFGWIVSDFGLNDAIESGLVKTPRVVVRDDSRLSAKDYKARFFHIYADDEVKDDLNRRAEPQEPLPDLVMNAYHLLGQHWQETYEAWRKEGHQTPPVMITVGNRTETAARIKYAFDHGRVRIDALSIPDKTLHIDSKVLEKAESQAEPPPLIAAPSDDAEDERQEKPQTKQQQAELLRRTVDSVGQTGKAGEQIRHVISVGMLSEGWDAKTVTHVMGLRAFSSQLLCEQVVGRGLRRTSYDVNSDGFFEAEYVNIFGVPFTFLPHEDGGENPPPPPPPKKLVEPVRERETDYAISWPNILRIEHVYTPMLSLDLAKVPRLQLNAHETATRAELAVLLDGKPDLSTLSEIDLEELGRKFRQQRIVFETARDVFDQMQPGWNGSRDVLLSQVIHLVERMLSSNRISITPDLFNADEVRRRIVLTLNMTKIVHHIWEAIRCENTERLEPVFDSQRPILSTANMRPWYTGRPCDPTRRSHINLCVYDSTHEKNCAIELDREKQQHVAAWIKNDHLDFEILYVFQGVVRKYRPDFLIRLTNGTTLILEIKGQDTQEDQVKRRFLDEWVRAVNAH